MLNRRRMGVGGGGSLVFFFLNGYKWYILSPIHSRLLVGIFFFFLNFTFVMKAPSCRVCDVGAGVSNLSHCRTFMRQTGQNVRQAIFKYDPFFWQFEEKITEVSQNFRCRETKTVLSSPNGPLLINTPSLSKHRFMPSGQNPSLIN